MRCGADPAANLRTAVERIGAAAKQGAQIVCLPELFRSQYFCQSEDHDAVRPRRADPRPDHRGAGGGREAHGVVIVGSLFERRAAGVYHNTAVVLDADGALAGMYRKMHIPDDPLYYEKFYFTPGDLGFRSFADARRAGSARWSAGTSGTPRRRA